MSSVDDASASLSITSMVASAMVFSIAARLLRPTPPRVFDDRWWLRRRGVRRPDAASGTESAEELIEWNPVVVDRAQVERRHRPDDDDARRVDTRVAELTDRAARDRLLVGGRRADRSHRRGRVESTGDQFGGDRG